MDDDRHDAYYAKQQAHRAELFRGSISRLLAVLTLARDYLRRQTQKSSGVNRERRIPR